MIFRTELRRGTAPVAALGMAIATTWVLCVHPEEWTGRWVTYAGYLRICLLALGPVLVAAGAWLGGRDRRSDLTEVLGTTARPAWQPALVAWAAVTVGGTLGALLPLAVAAVLVARVATYPGTGWWWTLAVGLLAFWPATALGFAAGRLVPLRVIAPVAGVATYVGLAAPVYFGGRTPALVFTTTTETDVWPLSFPAWQAAWALAVTAVLLLIAVRKPILAAVPAVALVALGFVTPPDRPGVDPGATVPVCTTSGPQICVAQVNAYQLDRVTRVAQPLLTKVAGIEGAPVRAIDRTVNPAPGPDTVVLELTLDADGLRESFRQITYADACPVFSDERADATQTLAQSWLLDGDSALDTLPPQRRRAWFGDYLAAARRCDTAALIALGDPR